ncbi:oligosaccharide repeat unit polymerase [Xenorhabdus thailandensis]|uniref:oligosaccharide repeat unit polymerase n=1 Tax=Xenorhabdus thailandensis TaxID=3136255 RepID=UPI0030F466ED
MNNIKTNKNIIKLFIICELLCFFFVIIKHKYVSDYFGVDVTVSNNNIILFFIGIIFLYLSYYYSWIKTTLFFNSRKKFKSLSNLNSLFLILVILYFIFLIKTGVGKVTIASEPKNLLNGFEKIIFLPIILLKINFLIYLYAAGCRNKNKIYYLSLIIFVIAELYRGVSFPILLLGIIEYKKWKKYAKLRYIFVFFPILLLFINTVYNLKYMMRMGDEYTYIDILQTSLMLAGRLSVLSNILYNYEHIESLRNAINSYSYNPVSEFLEKLTPMPSLFGINDKIIEFGKIIFENSYGRLDSAIAISVMGMIFVIPDKLYIIMSILFFSYIFIHFIIGKLDCSNEQNIVAFFFVLLTLYQGFWGILANYLYSLFVYLLIVIINQMLVVGLRNNCEQSIN